MLKKFYKKIKSVYDEVIGTATVVCPEVIINKDWDPNTEYISGAMRVPSKNFYDYLGPYICKDEALRSGTYKDETGEEVEGFGLGRHPYNNDLGKAMDRKVFSSPAPLGMTIDYSDDSEIVLNVQAHGQNFTLQTNVASNGVPYYRVANKGEFSYEWKGTWGDVENGFETSITLKVSINIRCEKTPGGVFGSGRPTGCWGLVFVGSDNDLSSETYVAPIRQSGSPSSSGSSYNTGWKKFYNQNFSTGPVQVGNGSHENKIWIVTIYRKPFEKKVLIRGMAAARSGEYEFLGLSYSCPVRDPYIGVGQGLGATVPISWAICPVFDLVVKPIVQLINEVFAVLLGKNEFFQGDCEVEVEIMSRTFMSIDKELYMQHPAQKNFHPNSTTPVSPTETLNEYLYTQFFYPDIMKNPLYGFSDTFNYKAPYFDNLVVENTMYNDRVVIEHPLIKKYKYFTPGLFSLLYETNIGVFYEQLTKQLSNKGIARSYSIKTSGHTTTTNPNTVTTKQEESLFDIIFPTNSSKWNNYLNNTGWTTTGKADSSFLGNFISGASVSVSGTGSGVPSDYSSALSDYGISPSIAKADEVIGEFQFIKSQVLACGGDLDAWTESCNLHCQELSTGSPKNLALKLAQFIVWYLDPRGIAAQTRTSATSLIEYEKLLDKDIDDYRTAAAGGGDAYKNYHIIGTEKYDRNCIQS